MGGYHPSQSSAAIALCAAMGKKSVSELPASSDRSGVQPSGRGPRVRHAGIHLHKVSGLWRAQGTPGYFQTEQSAAEAAGHVDRRQVPPKDRVPDTQTS